MEYVTGNYLLMYEPLDTYVTWCWFDVGEVDSMVSTVLIKLSCAIVTPQYAQSWQLFSCMVTCVLALAFA